MLSVTDLMDFIDLDRETVQVVSRATNTAPEVAIVLSWQFLATKSGRETLHHMYRDQIAEAESGIALSREHELRRAYAHFSRKYPLI